MKRKLQVFISSTYTDLISDRQAAVSATLKAGHIPAGMELFTAGDKSQMQTIQRWIDESDVYMLILGGRYGSIEPTSGKSYTELEFDYAVSRGKPLFSVVIDKEALENRVKNNGSHYIERENPNLLKSFEEKVLSNISSFFSDEKDIRLCVYESLSEFAANRLLQGWVSASEIEDASLLHDELRTLRAENETLKAQIAQSAKVSQLKPENQRLNKIEEIIGVLSQTELVVPAEASAEKEEITIDALSSFYNNKNTLISGVTNSTGMTAAQRYLYFRLAPILQIHGLVENEKVAGVRYRRSFVTKFGMEFLAECERRMLRTKAEASAKK